MPGLAYSLLPEITTGNLFIQAIILFQIDNLQDVHNLLLETIREFKENGGVLDEGVSIFLYPSLKFILDFLAVYNENSFRMTTYVRYNFAQLIFY